MATIFPLATYPLSPKTGFLDNHVMGRDDMDDGSINVRILGDNTYRTIKCVFVEMSSTNADVFEEYLRYNRAVEFDIVYKTKTYRGHIWSDVKVNYKHSDSAVVSFAFKGVVI